MRYQFTKMQSLGNDFVILNGIFQEINMSSSFAIKIANRHFGIGCDQIIIAERRTVNTNLRDSDFKLRIFNSDGTEVGQCGNGARCFGQYLRDQGLTKQSSISVNTDKVSMLLEIKDDGTILVDMGKPEFDPRKVPFLTDKEAIFYDLNTDGGVFQISVLSIGNPHAVHLVKNIETINVISIGKIIESHYSFPERVNVGFMELMSRQKIKLRVYERGTGATLGCGSAACAAVVTGIRMGILDSHVQVSLPGGDTEVIWNSMNESVYYIGSAVKVFEGVIEMEPE